MQIVSGTEKGTERGFRMIEDILKKAGLHQTEGKTYTYTSSPLSHFMELALLYDDDDLIAMLLAIEMYILSCPIKIYSYALIEIERGE